MTTTKWWWYQLCKFKLSSLQTKWMPDCWWSNISQMLTVYCKERLSKLQATHGKSDYHQTIDLNYHHYQWKTGKIQTPLFPTTGRVQVNKKVKVKRMNKKQGPTGLPLSSLFRLSLTFFFGACYYILTGLQCQPGSRIARNTTEMMTIIMMIMMAKK